MRKKRNDICTQACNATGLSTVRLFLWALDDIMTIKQIEDQLTLYANGGKAPKEVRDYARELVHHAQDLQKRKK